MITKGMTKVKRTKKVVIRGKQKSKVKTSSDKVENLILAAIKKSGKVGYYHSEPNSASYRAVKYFLENKPKEGKVYKAAVVLKGYDRAIPFIRRNVQRMLLLVNSQFKKIVMVKNLNGFKNKWVEFKFMKK